MSLLNLAALEQATVHTDPFDYLVVPGFLARERARDVLEDFPAIAQGGSFPLHSLTYGDHFGQLCCELEGAEMRRVIAGKLDLDLTSRPTTLTVRGHCRSKDGKIHVDSKTKLVTVLLYLNSNWNHAGGCLRLLRNGRDIESTVAEVKPELGTLVVFRNGPTAWHGHTSYEGVRRAMQLNWVTDEQAVRRSERRHGLSAFWKQLGRRFFSTTHAGATAYSLDDSRAA